MITSLSHVYFPVRDIDETIDFYTQKLAFSLLRRWSNNGRESAYLSLDGILLELNTSETTPSSDGRTELRLGLTVDDMDATLSELRGKGVEVAREPWDAYTFWGRQAQIKDPSGYIISLREWRAPDGPNFEGWQPTTEGVTRLA